jgi:uncharacterized ubiquitin-like protein YukD
MINSVLLTVKVEWAGLEYDMALPANIPGAALCPRLLSALKSIEYPKFRGVETISIHIEHACRALGGDETLDAAAVWDGSVIIVKSSDAADRRAL